MNKLPYTFYNIPDEVFENSRLPPYAKLVFAFLIKRESLTVGALSGKWFPLYYETMASPLGVKPDTVRQKYIPQLVETGLIETKTEQGFDRSKWTPKRTCMFRIAWDTIINKL